MRTATTALFCLALTGCALTGVKSPEALQASRDALLAAVESGDATAAGELLRRNKGIADSPDGHGGTLLHTACFRNDSRIVLLLLAGGADAGARKPDGWTPLHFAAWKGNAGIAKALLARGADVDARNGDGATSLHIAAYEGQAEIASLLIGHGASANARKNDGWTPLRLAAMRGHEVVIAILREHGAGE